MKCKYNLITSFYAALLDDEEKVGGYLYLVICVKWFTLSYGHHRTFARTTSYALWSLSQIYITRLSVKCHFCLFLVKSDYFPKHKLACHALYTWICNKWTDGVCLDITFWHYQINLIKFSFKFNCITFI